MKFFRLNFLILGAVLICMAHASYAAKKSTKTAAKASVKVSAEPSEKPSEKKEQKEKKKFVYKSHTQIDLSGDTVQGKVRAPEVFYIFQRKRSESHHVVKTPVNFDHHRETQLNTMRRGLPK